MPYLVHFSIVFSEKSNEKGDGGIEDDVNRACTDETLTGDSVNVVLVTPVKQKEKCTHSIEDHDDEEQHAIIRGVRDRCGQTLPNGRANDNNKGDSCMEDDIIPAYTDDRLTGNTLDLVLVTPPQQKEKRNQSIEDDDDYDKHPIIPGVKDGGGPKLLSGTGKGNKKHNRGIDVESEDVLHVTPEKQNQKDNPATEDVYDGVVDDDESPISEAAEEVGGKSVSASEDDQTRINQIIEVVDNDQTRSSDGGPTVDANNGGPVADQTTISHSAEDVYNDVEPAVTQVARGKDFTSTFNCGYNDDDFVDPPVSHRSQNLGGEEFIKGIQVSEMYGYNDVVPVFNDMGANSFHPQDIDYSKEDSEIYVGRLFKDKAQFKVTMHIYALAKVCRFKFRHCKRFITAKCVDKECSWRVVGKQLGESPTYMVKKGILDHVCSADVRGLYKKHGTSKVLAALLRLKYERLHSGPRAFELPKVLRTEFNYPCSYWKAWKARELAIAFAQGTEEMSYKMLPQYLHVLKLANPGLITDIETEVDDEGNTRFKYACMSLKACIDGWKHLRKVLVVDGTHMFGKYKGCLLSASGQDADTRVFPIAFAVVKARIQILGSGFSRAKEQWYPRAHHGICLVHLQRNVQEKYKGLSQKAMVGWAGEAYKVSEFQKVCDLIKLTD
ncbi:hypothetical protein Rs2_21621 [Raphanus sativus]|nr:hypothetical protein Rs2_21621 [Raphanus sativus]